MLDKLINDFDQLSSPGCNSSWITVKLGREVSWAKLSAEFVHERLSSLNEQLTS